MGGADPIGQICNCYDIQNSNLHRSKKCLGNSGHYQINVSEWHCWEVWFWGTSEAVSTRESLFDCAAVRPLIALPMTTRTLTGQPMTTLKRKLYKIDINGGLKFSNWLNRGIRSDWRDIQPYLPTTAIARNMTILIDVGMMDFEDQGKKFYNKSW